MGKSVLIIDDSMYMRTLINNSLTEGGYEVVGMAGDGETGIEMALEFEPDVITLDNVLPDMIGLDILKILKDEGLKSTIIMVSAVGQQSVVDEGMGLGAADYIVKPFTPEGLLEKVNDAYNKNN
jgi:two-component system chemotaxis response regulator CheY